ncbi:MAG: transporter substrate-binding domain-containing protein [Chitinispirillales bacterium]|jgi:ABC-type amino acid transport substrate-binding protein|nr:transporter substrate-binding domain-containing protein [Chitinispirillales bacterium]
MNASTVKSILAAAAVSLPLVMAGCGGDGKSGKANGPASESAAEARAFRAEDFAGKTIAVLSGSTFDDVARNIIGAQKIKYYNSPAEAVEGVKNGEADATIAEEPVAKAFVAENPDALALVYPPVDIENYATIFPKKDNGKLLGEFNAFLAKTRSDGTYEDMVRRWVDTPETPPMPEIEPAPAKGKPTLPFATSDSDKPFSFKAASGKIEGFDVEMALRFAREYGYGLDIKIMDFTDIIPSVQAGSVAFASNLITVTEERKTLIDFSDPVYYSGTVMIVRK